MHAAVFVHGTVALRFVKSMTARIGFKRVSTTLDETITAVSALGLVFWFLRMTFLTKVLNDMSNQRYPSDMAVTTVTVITMFIINAVINYVNRFSTQPYQEPLQSKPCGWKVRRSIMWNGAYICFKVRLLSKAAYLAVLCLQRFMAQSKA